MTPLMRLAAAWLGGVVLAACWRPDPRPAATAVVAAGVLALLSLVWRRTDSVSSRRRPTPVGRLRPSAAAGVRIALRLALVGALGVGRYAWADRPPDENDVSRHNGNGRVAITGRIVDEPEVRDRGVHYRVAVGTARGEKDSAPREVHGLLLVQASPYPVFSYGDHVALTATLEAPPELETFDYRAYLARQGVYSIARYAHLERLSSGGNPVRHGLIAIKARAKAALAASIAEPEAALATGILLGDDRGLPRRLADDFRSTNTSHVIAISGSNIALLVTVVAAFFVRVGGRRRAAVPTVTVVGLYTVLVGADPAVVRAAIMGGVAVLAGPWGRRQHGPTTLAAAAFGMTVWNPLVVHDLGFQLSFAATAGLMGLAKPLDGALAATLRRLSGSGASASSSAPTELQGGPLGILWEPLVLTLAAQIATWPLIAASTGQLSGVGLGANLLIVPAQPFIMIGAGLTAIVGTFIAPAGRVLGAFTWLPLAWTVHVVEAAARLPLASIPWRLPWLGAVGYYAVLLVVAGPGPRRCWSVVSSRASDGFGALLSFGRNGSPRAPRHGPFLPRFKPAVLTALTRGGALRRILPRLLGGWRAAILLAASATVVWASALARPDGLLHLFVLDVGQGDALLVVTPSGARMLVDGGPGKSGVLAGLGRRWPPWDRRLDLVVLSHPDADHVGGLAGVLDRYRVGAVLDPQMEGRSGEAAAWLAGLRSEGATVVRAESGQRIVLDEAAGVNARVLWPPSMRRIDLDPPTNNNAVVLRVEYGRIALLLTADIEAPVEEALLASEVPLQADVLKVAHHGSAGSSGIAFVEAVRPRLAVISVGADNTFGHPASPTLERLAGVVLRRTDQEGTIEVISDGQAVWVR